MGKKEKILIIWLILSIILSILFAIILETAIPIFTIIWLSVILIVVLRTKNAEFVGFSFVPLNELIKATLLNLGTTIFIIGLFEPWSHTYQMLLRLATESNNPDITFSWLTRFSGVKSWIGMFVFSGLVTMFGEEIFFRGFLFQYFRKRVHPNIAIIIQSLFFIIPNILVSLFMTSLQGVIYTIVYAGIGIGIVGGFSAKKTNSIWPSLITAVIVNMLAVLLLY